MRRPLFVVFEGIDGSGTTTQCQRLVELANCTDGCIPVYSREPGGTPLAERIRDLVLDPGAGEMNSTTELFLYAASRAQHVGELIAPALAAGHPVICDRFTDSTLAYQGYGRNIDLDVVDYLNNTAAMGCVPDTTVYLDISLSEAIRRRNLRGRGSDRLEAAGNQLQGRVLEGYRHLAEKRPNYLVVDAGETEEAVAEDIRAKVLSRWPYFPYAD